MNTQKKEATPEEFKKVIADFINDILITFPEYEPIVKKWWDASSASKMDAVFSHCLRVFPERFMDILYQQTNIFADDSTVNTEFLPGISFKYLWNSDISDKTKETIWKYLQLILMTLVGSIKDKDSFGNTASLLETVNQDEFKEKLQETMEGMRVLFEKVDADSNATGGDGINSSKNADILDDLPSANDIHKHISGMMHGKLGQLAQEIAEETADSFNVDMENATSSADVLQNIMKNPAKIMGLVKSVGDKLQSKIDSGEMNQHDLFSEATELMSKMKNVPGMDNIQGILEKMGGLIPGLGKNVKVDTNAMETKLKKNTQMMAMRERMKKNMETKTVQKALEQFQMEQRMKQQQQSTLGQELSIDELVASLGFDDVLPSPPPSTGNGNGKKQKCDKKNKKKMDGDKK